MLSWLNTSSEWWQLKDLELRKLRSEPISSATAYMQSAWSDQHHASHVRFKSIFDPQGHTDLDFGKDPN